MNTSLRCLSLLLLTTALSAQSERDWRNWRGPYHSGAAHSSARPPLTWSDTDKVHFKVAIPGSSSSSPILLGDRIYLMTGIVTDQDGEAPVKPLPGRRFAGPVPTKVHEFAVLALQRETGKRIWQKTVVREVPHEGLHKTTSQVAASPVSDGEHIYAFFGSRGLYCLDLEGEVRWHKRFGLMRTRREWGEGASPALHADTIVVNWDHEGASFVVALDKRTGKERWRQARDEVTSWTTPLIVEVDGGAQVVIPATTASRGYDLKTGEVIWSLAGMTVNTIPSPMLHEGLVYLMSGYRGRMIQAVRLAGAKGDLAGSDKLVWRYTQAASYVPSGLLYRDTFYFLRGNSSVLTALDAKTGEPRYEAVRIPGSRTIYASPVAAAGRIYLTGRDGTTQVLAAGPKPELLATNRLDATIDATPVIVGRTIFLRSRAHLYAIRAPRDQK